MSGDVTNSMKKFFIQNVLTSKAYNWKLWLEPYCKHVKVFCAKVCVLGWTLQEKILIYFYTWRLKESIIMCWGII